MIDLFDIFCVLDCFQGVFQNCPSDVCDLSAAGGACDGDGQVNIFDILAVLDAFAGAGTCPNVCVNP